jgi:ribosome modulation factor
VVDQEQDEMTAHEQGREARLCCRGRDENPFYPRLQPEEHAEWLRGWDEADNEPD